jgi:tetratricopeptide (TPR) repeat protein
MEDKNTVSNKNKIFWIINLVVFLTPLFFLPWTASKLGMDNFNKIILIIILIPLAAGLFIFELTKNKSLIIKKSVLALPIVLFLFLSFLSALFGIDRFSSFFGGYNNAQAPFFYTLCLVLVYFLLVNIIGKKEEILKIIKTFLYSYYVILIFSFAALFAVRLGIINTDGRLVAYFNSITGTIEDLSIFIAVGTVLLSALLYNVPGRDLFFKTKRAIILARIILIISFLFILTINFSPAWWCLLFGEAIMLFIGRCRPGVVGSNLSEVNNLRSIFKKYILPSCLIIVPLFFISLNFVSSASHTDARLAGRLQLDYKNTMSISLRAVKERPLFGFGPDSFNYIFSKFRSPALNNSDYWFLRFNKGCSYIAELPASVGLLGAAGYLFLVISIFYYISRFAKNNLAHGNDNIVFMSLVSVLTALFAGQILFSANTVLLFLFWLFLGLLFACLNIENDETGEIKIVKPIYFRLLVLLIFLAVAGWVLLAGYVVKYWLAENYSRQSNSVDALTKAASLNPNRNNYQIVLAKYYLQTAMSEFNKSGQGNSADIQKNINNSIGWAKQAIATAPESVSSYETLGMIYSQIGPYSNSSNSIAISAFEKALALEPTNPVLATQLGKTYLANNQADKAVSTLLSALQLKSDYTEAGLNLAKAYEAQNDLNNALIILNKLSPDDQGVNFELGKIYYNQKKYDQAIGSFRKVVTVSPNNANALYSLALAYEKTGDNKSAVYYYKKVFALNSDRPDIKNKINQLENRN